ncbi:MAG: heme lyase CcmF/NrfE family subunit [Parvibaculaceae bacterium]|nr:heme lyase CcmF/NrfE family subunit [Parvibaculaceae bacterium]
MIAEFGHFVLVLALGVALVQAFGPLLGMPFNAAFGRLAVPAARVQFVLLSVSFLALVYAFAVSDFSLSLVTANSHSAKPLIYKLTGAWGNHEGSMLLWTLILATFGAAVAFFGGNLPDGLRARVLGVQGLIGAAFLMFLLFTSNPFLRLDPAPFDGNGLNPILQDPALAFHPPFLYAGYVGFSIAFSFAVAALLEGKVDPAWARWVRPWTLAAWCCLTLGIAMGSWWAYYELGWGGWWFWDPVENASLMPWLLGTALLHSAIVVEKRGALKRWTLLLAIFTFALSLIGTFLVRSGVLTSVHAFAVDPARGVVILGILVFFVGGALTLYAIRAPALKVEGLFAPLSREAALIVNNLLLTAATVAVFVGTLYPLALDAVDGSKISVGAPFYNLTFVPIVIPLLLLVPFGPMLGWKRADVLGATQRLGVAAAISTIGLAAAWMWQNDGPWGAPFGIALGVWLIAGAFSEIGYRVRLFRGATVAEAFGKARRLPRSAWGTAMAHAGVGVMVIGIVGITSWRVEVIEALAPGATFDVGSYAITFQNVESYQGPNFRADRGSFLVERNGKEIATLTPEKRVYPVSEMPTTEAAIYTIWVADLYVVLGDPTGTGAWTVRAYVNPLVPWVWIGAVIMVLGGMISLSDRRYRVGAPVRARNAKPGVPA